MYKNVDYKTVVRHLIFWIAYILYTAINTGDRHHDSWRFDLPISALTEIPVGAIVVYINLYVLMPFYYKKQKYIQYTIWLIMLVFLGGFADRFFSWCIWLPRELFLDHKSDEPQELWIWDRIVKDSFLNVPVLTVTLVLKLMRDSSAHEKKLREIEKEKFAAEMHLLKAQINPHFFFNTLNSLYSLTLPVSKKASDVVVQLSDLMRYMLYEASAARVPLKNEMVHLANYIAIEHMRFKDRLDLSFQHSGDMEGKMVAPLLLLPFIENAFKHGIGDSSGWITIDLQVIKDQLFLKVENNCQELLEEKSGGLGLNNVKRRLELIYPGNYLLDIEQTNETFAVDLKINL
ncbi:MAG: histidine kinase [Bacteroidota bacterium]|nr:histidine kinase [Bacteroidota bacterium]